MSTPMEDGGPAFPIPHANYKHAVGMTLRDYFIAHAPAEPQSWFEPVMPPAPVAPAYLSDTTPEERREIDGFQEGYLAVKDCNQTRVRAWAEAKEAHNKAHRAHMAEAKKQFYLQWPTAWADEMLKARARQS